MEFVGAAGGYSLQGCLVEMLEILLQVAAAHGCLVEMLEVLCRLLLFRVAVM